MSGEKWYNEYRAITQDDLSEEYLKELDLLEKAVIEEDLTTLKEKIQVVKNLLKKMED